MRIRTCLFALATVVGLSSVARGQQVAAPDSNVASIDTSAAHVAVVSSIDRPSAVQRNAPAALVPMGKATMGLGRAKAMMAVGGAAIVVGALIGDDVGTIFMVSGAVVGLYGLWQYLQ